MYSIHFVVISYLFLSYECIFVRGGLIDVPTSGLGKGKTACRLELCSRYKKLEHDKTFYTDDPFHALCLYEIF